MANVIDRVSTRPRYPWAAWTDGKARRAKQGRDFFIPPKAFRNALYVRARRQELLVTVHIEGESVEFQFSPRRPARRKHS